jgi:hypothetical protein
MPTCEVCGEEEETVTKCKSCGTRFCEYCGLVEDKQCMVCQDFNDEGDSKKDEDDEDSDWR